MPLPKEPSNVSTHHADFVNALGIISLRVAVGAGNVVARHSDEKRLRIEQTLFQSIPLKIQNLRKWREMSGSDEPAPHDHLAVVLEGILTFWKTTIAPIS